MDFWPCLPLQHGFECQINLCINRSLYKHIFQKQTTLMSRAILMTFQLKSVKNYEVKWRIRSKFSRVRSAPFPTYWPVLWATLSGSFQTLKTKFASILFISMPQKEQKNKKKISCKPHLLLKATFVFGNWSQKNKRFQNLFSTERKNHRQFNSLLHKQKCGI